METYFGYIKTPQDALIIFEACRKNQLNQVKRRLTSKERTEIKSGSVFAWDEKEAGMRRWTDGRTWSPSRVLGSFLTYRELDTKRRPRRLSLTTLSPSTPYKTHGLIKQSFSICTSTNQRLHLISYYSKSDIQSGRLIQPSMDPSLSSIIQKGLYPELNSIDTTGVNSSNINSMRISLSTPSLSIDCPSLSSSPSTCIDELLSPLETNPPPPSAQDIAWGKIPCSEDQRQLNALKLLLRL